jgi:hypothetical protein
MESEIQSPSTTPPPPQEEKKIKFTHIGSGILVITIIIGAFLYGLSKQPSQPSQTPTIYFGVGSNEDGYFLINVETGEKQPFIPEGYEIVSTWDYQLFPTFLILKKDSDLYVYNVKDKTIDSVVGSDNSLKLKKNEVARVYSSITEKDKFIITIDTLDLSQVSEFDGSSPVLSSRTYTLEASTKVLASISNPKLNDGCAQYDSKHQRFFTWPCGEGIGSATPLSITDMNGNLQSTILTALDFGLTTDDWAPLHYQNGLFLAVSDQPNPRIIGIDSTSLAPVKESYSTRDDTIKAQLSDMMPPYSMSKDEQTHTLIFGGSDSVLLLRFDDQRHITQSTVIPDREIYANFIFVHDGKLYYHATDNIRIVNLTTWEIEKSIPSTSVYQEITLFSQSQ